MMNGKPPNNNDREVDDMYGQYQMTYYDESKEVSYLQVRIPEVDEINFVATDALVDALAAAVEAMSLGTLIKDTRTYITTKFAKTLPGDLNAQREKKFLVAYEDSVNFSKYSSEIPCADLSLLDTDGSTVDLTAGAGLALVTAFEALVISPFGNAVTVLEIRYVGRNL